MRRLFLTVVCIVCAAASLSAQTNIRDLYSTKAEACADPNYRYCAGYKQYGQIGWEREVGWRPIQYLDRYESEHRNYNINSFLYCQVVCGKDTLDDCEIVAFDSKGLVVGNQCPEPSPLKAGATHNAAIMAIFGNVIDEPIRFLIVTGTGTVADPLVERWAEETHLFVPNGTTGLSDLDGDGRLDTWTPVVLHISTPGTVTAFSDGGKAATLDADALTAGVLASADSVVIHGGWTEKQQLALNAALMEPDANQNAVLVRAVVDADFRASQLLSLFKGCVALSSASVRCESKTLMEETFAGCVSLTEVELAKAPSSAVRVFDGANPNCLVWLAGGNDSRYLPQDWTNMMVDGKAVTDIQLTDGELDNPHPFHCSKAVDLDGHRATFRRSGAWNYANGPGGWNTLVVPFEAELQADGRTVKPLPALDLSAPIYNKVWKEQCGYWACALFAATASGLTFYPPIGASATLAANTPYLFALPNHNFEKTVSDMTYSLNMEGMDLVFVCVGDELPATPAVIVGADEDESTDCHFKGTYTVRRSQPMYLLKNNATEQGHDAFMYKSKGNILPFRAYLEDKPGVAPLSSRAIRMGWEDMSTAIRDVACPVLDVAGTGRLGYELDGRKVAVQQVPRGSVVIVNGKKMIK